MSNTFLTFVIFVLFIDIEPTRSSERLRVVRSNSSLPTGRYYTSASFDGFDSIYIFGGHAYIDEILKYSISTDQIMLINRLPKPLYGGTVSMDRDGGAIFYMGGVEGRGGEGSRDIIKFSPSTGRVENSSATLPIRSYYSCAVKRDERSRIVYIFGGGVDQKGIVQFDMGSMETKRVGNLPQPYYIYGSCFSDGAGSAFLFGGTEPLQPALKMNLSTLQTEWGDQTIPVGYNSVAVWDGKSFAYIIGGSFVPGYPNDTIIRFNAETMEHEFLPLGAFPGANSLSSIQPSAVYVQSWDRIYIFGGQMDNELSDGIWYIELSPGLKPIMEAEPTELPILKDANTDFKIYWILIGLGSALALLLICFICRVLFKWKCSNVGRGQCIERSESSIRDKVYLKEFRAQAPAQLE